MSVKQRERFTIRYGTGGGQHVHCLPALGRPGAAAHGTVLLVHGGYWRAQFDAGLMEPLAAEFQRRGWQVGNVEYRRHGNGGGWPETIEDVRAAVRAITGTPWCRAAPGPVVGVGHSVGGQLALLAASGLDAVVALAPVTDTARTFHERLGEDAAAEFFGAGPRELPEQYADSSPVRQLPLGIPALVVHGANDARVPVSHSLDYVRAARSAGDRITLLEPADLGHLAAISPTAGHWDAVLTWLGSLADGKAPNKSWAWARATPAISPWTSRNAFLASGAFQPSGRYSNGRLGSR
ncbi:alpha/beta fold hydrolase [Arthrobacter sp. SDTb3-6]|nr:alpha/beta fold hydrolase [Arthrobacter sp. SDTb3-6]